MPLPTQPAKRAALLSEQDYDVPVRILPKAPKTKPPLTELTLTVTPQDQPTFNNLEVTDREDQLATKTLAQAQVRTEARPRKIKHNGPAKLFVLDTNVLLHDPTCLFRFEEHDIFLPMIVLEELDAHKKGMNEVARNARQTSRILDALASHQGADITAGLPLNSTGHREANGRLFFQTQFLNYALPAILPQDKADNQILGVVEALRQKYAAQGNESRAGTHEVVLVSKDINMRVKSRALGLATDDYQNDKTLAEGDLLYAGLMILPANFWATHGKTVESWQQGIHTFYSVTGPIIPLSLIHISEPT